MIEAEVVEYVLTANDRCDAKECGAQAYVLVKGMSGELMFCAHHYNKFNGEKLQSFAFEVINETNRLVENKTKGEDY